LVQKRLTIHVIGAGKGESIILEMPDRKWGVVDCYASSVTDKTTNQTLSFLQRKNVEGLEFLCLTHPHEDHYRGMVHLIKQFNGNILRFWRFTPRPLAQVVAYIQAAAMEYGARSGSRTGVAELAELFMLIRRMRKEKDRYAEEFVELVEGFKLLLTSTIRDGENEIPLRILALGPSGNLVDAYQEMLGRYFAGKIEYASRINQIHNLISGVLLVIYGETRVVLGGDVEGKGWEYIMKHPIRASSDESIAAHLVKVSHHGSTTNLVSGLWEALTADKNSNCYAVLTPFVTHGLPKGEVIEHIAHYTNNNVYSTCLSEPRYREPESVLREYHLNRLSKSADDKGRFVPDLPSRIIHRCSFSFGPSGDCICRCTEGNSGPLM